MTYRIALRQEGTRLSGEGERWAVEGRQLPVRTPIEISGSIDERELRLHFVERRTGRFVSGTFHWLLASGGTSLTGTFTSGGTDAHGASSAVRLR